MLPRVNECARGRCYAAKFRGKDGQQEEAEKKAKEQECVSLTCEWRNAAPLLTASSGRATAEADDSDPLLAYIQHDADYLSTSAKAARDGVNRLLKSMGPTCEAEAKRRKIAVYVAGLLNEAGFSCHLNGSYALKTYLPDSDIDLGVLTQRSGILIGGEIQSRIATVVRMAEIIRVKK